VKPHFPYHVAFQIHMGYSKYTIKCAVVDEGVATCEMSLLCWKYLNSPTLSKSLNMLTSFDDHSFCPHGILHAFPIQLSGKTVVVEVEVVDAPLDYNLLLGCNWNYHMIVIVSFIFCTLCFPHDGKIVVIDQLSFAYTSPNEFFGPSIPVIKNSQPATENISFKMYSSIMGTFDVMALFHHVYAMSNRPVSIERSISFHTSYFNDPWTLPSSTVSCEGQSHTGIISPISVSHIGDWSTTCASHVEDQPPSTTSHVEGMNLFISSHTAHTSPTSTSHVGDSLPTSIGHVGHSSPTSTSHVGDFLLASASHAKSMSSAVESHDGGIHTIEKPRCVKNNPSSFVGFAKEITLLICALLLQWYRKCGSFLGALRVLIRLWLPNLLWLIQQS
jgi:hypothetical protein